MAVAMGYLELKDGVSCGTSSHMWDGWYFARTVTLKMHVIVLFNKKRDKVQIAHY